MLVTEEYGKVTQARMGREMDGHILYWVAVYLVDGLLIDTGCLHTAEELLHFLEDKEVRAVFITHYHEDHIGGAALLQENLDLQIWGHPRTAELASLKPKLYPYQKIVWGDPEPCQINPLRENIIATENYRFEVIKTPGHSEDHCVLVEPEEGWCFSGDLFVSEKIKVLREEEDIGAIMESMHKLLRLDGYIALFTAIGKVEPHGNKALQACLDNLETLKHKTGQLKYEQGLNEEQIVEHLFGGESSLYELTNKQLSCKNMINSLLKKP